MSPNPTICIGKKETLNEGVVIQTESLGIHISRQPTGIPARNATTRSCCDVGTTMEWDGGLADEPAECQFRRKINLGDLFDGRKFEVEIDEREYVGRAMQRFAIAEEL
jgi:hypothetical protein